MDTFNKPYRECCLHSDPTHVYDLVGWDPANKLYRLENDLGQKVFVRSHEFTLISAAHEDLLMATEQGLVVPEDVKIVTVEDLMAGGWLAIPLETQSMGIPGEGPSEPRPCASASTRPEARTTPPKAKGTPRAASPDATGAKGRVRELLANAKSREEIAEIAQPVLLESVEYLIGKYKHLDNGRFRMTIGNRMVGVFKKTGADL